MFFNKRRVSGSGLLNGFTDWHSHILPGVDDGVKHLESSLRILDRLEKEGVTRVVFTPHIMEDVPNTPTDLRQRFDNFLTQYTGNIQLSLGAENMLDHLFEQRLESGDLLPLNDRFLLVETSYFNPPFQMEELLERIREHGYTPVLAHPERYQYMDMEDYKRLHQNGIIFQLNIPSLTGAYGEVTMNKAKELLERDWYQRLGMDIHSYHFLDAFLHSKMLKKEIKKLKAINEQSI